MTVSESSFLGHACGDHAVRPRPVKPMKGPANHDLKLLVAPRSTSSASFTATHSWSDRIGMGASVWLCPDLETIAVRVCPWHQNCSGNRLSRSCTTANTGLGGDADGRSGIDAR